MQIISSILKEKKLKLTPQRLAIFSVLYNTNSHPTAETIHSSLSVSHPSMSLATVYKTLDSFKKAGLVQELNLCEDSFRYDANCEPHMHSICSKCNQVFDIPFPSSIENLNEEVELITHFKIDNQRFYFYGTCEDCQ